MRLFGRGRAKIKFDPKTEYVKFTKGQYKEAFSAYEDGKKRRYDLLFAANVGVLAIASISPVDWRYVVLGIAMIIFTWTMTSDIDAFGKHFRFSGSDDDESKEYDFGFYREAGERVLKQIRWILCLTWFALIINFIWRPKTVEIGTVTELMKSAKYLASQFSSSG